MGCFDRALLIGNTRWHWAERDGALWRMAKHELGLLEQISVAFVNGASALQGQPASRRSDPLPSGTPDV